MPQLLLLLLLLVLVAAAAAAVVIVVVACACVRVLCVCACVRVRVRVRVCVCVYVSVSNGTPVIAASGDTGGGMKAALQKFSGCADPDTTAMGPAPRATFPTNPMVLRGPTVTLSGMTTLGGSQITHVI